MKCSQCDKEIDQNYCKCQDCGKTECVDCAQKQCFVCTDCGGQMQYLS